MDKRVIKLELIAEWIYLIILLTWGLLISIVTFIFLCISYSEKFHFGVFFVSFLYSLLYIFSIVIIIQNLKIIKQNLNGFNALKQTNNIPLFTLKTILTIFWLALIYPIFSGLLVFIGPSNLDGGFESLPGLELFQLFCRLAGIYWSIAYTLINSNQAIEHLAQHNLSLFKRVCFTGSIIPIFLFLIDIVLQIPLIFIMHRS